MLCRCRKSLANALEPSSCAAIARGEKSLRLSPRDPHLSGIYLLLAWSRLVLDRLQEAVDLFIKGRIAELQRTLAGARLISVRPRQRPEPAVRRA